MDCYKCGRTYRNGATDCFVCGPDEPGREQLPPKGPGYLGIATQANADHGPTVPIVGRVYEIMRCGGSVTHAAEAIRLPKATLLEWIERGNDTSAPDEYRLLAGAVTEARWESTQLVLQEPRRLSTMEALSDIAREAEASGPVDLSKLSDEDLEVWEALMVKQQGGSDG